MEQLNDEGEETNRPRLIYPKKEKKEVFTRLERKAEEWYNENSGILNVENDEQFLTLYNKLSELIVDRAGEVFTYTKQKLTYGPNIPTKEQNNWPASQG